MDFLTGKCRRGGLKVRELFFIIIVLGLVSCFGEKQRVRELTKDATNAIKGAVALMIILGHCVIATNEAKFSFMNVGWYGVAVFFFLSGWGVACGYKIKKGYFIGFLKNRFVKVLVPFFTAHILYYCIKTAFGVRFSFGNILSGFIGRCDIVDNAWYPVAAIIFYLVFWLIFKLDIKEKMKVIFLFIVVIIITVIQYLILGQGEQWWFISNVAFPIGVIVYLSDAPIIKKKLWVITGIMLFLLGYMLIPILGRVFGTYYYGVYILTTNMQSAGVALIVISVVCMVGKYSQLSVRLGEISYEIYLLHGLFIWIFSKFFTLGLFELFMLTTICSIILAYFMRCINRRLITAVL